jgi:VWFA-related protein
MNHRAAVAVAVFPLFLASLPSAKGSPADPAPREDPALVVGSGVSLVMLPVFVMDGDGHAVRGLQAEDFSIEEDGRPALPVYFRYVDTTDREDLDQEAVSSAARRRFLLLFDKSFTDLAGLHRAQVAAVDFVRHRLTSADLAAVATFDVRRGIRLVANFTEDRALLAHAVETLGVPQIARISDPLALAADFGLGDITQGRESDTAIPQDELDSVLAVLVRQMRSAEERAYRDHISTLIAALEDLARGLRGVEGRKQVIFLSAGFDARLLVGQWGDEQKQASESLAQGRMWEVDGLTRYGDSRLRDLLADATRDLNRADAVVHSVDVTGLGSDASLQQATYSRDLARNTNNRESLGYLAAETGGRFFKDSNNLAPALAEMLEMTSRYYVLGFQPRQEKGPGTFHKVRVRVARKGVKLSHRSGYFEREPVAGETTLQRQFDAAQLIVTGFGRNDLDFKGLCLPFPREGDRQTLGLVLQVPKKSLRWQAGEETTLEVYGYAVGEDGTVRDHLAQFARLDPARADPDGSRRGVSFFGSLSVPAGRYTIRLMVQDEKTGATGVQFLEVTVPPYDPKAAFVLPPVVADDPGRWLALDMGSGKADERRPPFPFEVAGEPFLPRASFEVKPGESERLVLITYEPSVLRDPATDVEVRSSLTTRDGRAAPAGRLRIERVDREAGGRRTYVFTYNTPDALEAGDYTLHIGLGEGGALAQSYALLRVRSES